MQIQRPNEQLNDSGEKKGGKQGWNCATSYHRRGSRDFPSFCRGQRMRQEKQTCKNCGWGVERTRRVIWWSSLLVNGKSWNRRQKIKKNANAKRQKPPPKSLLSSGPHRLRLESSSRGKRKWVVQRGSFFLTAWHQCDHDIYIYI